jgi:enoyl-CoA hydratase
MESIALEVRDGIALLRLEHGKANAMDVELCRSLRRRAEDCADPSVRAVVLTGTGRIFSAGVDLKRFTAGGAAYVSEFVPVLTASLYAWFALEKPVVAAVNGHAVAGGCILACAADVRLMAAGSGRIGVPELRVGLPFPTVPLEIMRYALAPQHAQAVVYEGATYEPEEARAIGMIDEVVAPEALLDRAFEKARFLGAYDARLFAVTKQQLRADARARIAAGERDRDPMIADMWTSEDTIARVRDYIASTLPAR